MRLRTLAAATLVVAVVLSVTSTVGLSAGGADRDHRIAVVEDERAFLGLSWYALERCGDRALVDLSNRLPGRLTDVDVSVVETDRLRAEVRSVPDELAPGESATVGIRLTPERANRTDRRSVTVRVEASGPSVDVTVHERRRPVTRCPTRRGGD